MNGARRTFSVLWVLLLVSPMSAAPSGNGDAAPESPRDLGHQVWALQAMHDLDLTTAQLNALRTLAPAAAPPGTAPTTTAATKVPQKYLTALQSLRTALLKGDEADDDRIDELRDDVDAMRDDDDFDADDDVCVTDEARKQVPALLRLLTPSQVAAYLAAYQDEIPDPVESLTEALGDLVGAGKRDADETINETADEVAGLLAGVDPEKNQAVAAKVKQWLSARRGLTQAEYKAKQAEFERSARELVGDVDAFVVLRHWLERDLAELLANPQLIPAIDARLRSTAAAKQ